MRIKSLKTKLILSYVFVIFVSFGLTAFFLDKNLSENPPGSARESIIFSLIFALGLVFVLGSLFTASIMRPVKKIISASRRFSAGDFSRKIYHDSKDEIGELAENLNKMARDIEEKIKDVSAQGQQLKAVFDSMIEGVIVTDKEGRIVSVNPAVEKIFEVTKNEAQGKIFLEAIRNSDIAQVLNSVLKTGNLFSQEIALIYPVRRIFEVNAAPIFHNQAISGCLLVIHDITEIRRLETIRRDFVANVSHELKTPLTAIKGFVETLLGGAVDDKENNRNFLKIILNHAQRLDNLVSDLLVLSHLESQQIEINKSVFDLGAQVREVLAGFSTQVGKKKIEIIDQTPKELMVSADRDRTGQVLTNLIDNAIKFNKDKGYIKIYKEEDNGNLRVVIEDSGMGVPHNDLQRIFERFYRVDKARSRELGGTGLGLSIVKHIVELHGGSVGVESTEGHGSKFWFTLPK